MSIDEEFCDLVGDVLQAFHISAMSQFGAKEGQEILAWAIEEFLIDSEILAKKGDDAEES